MDKRKSFISFDLQCLQIFKEPPKTPKTARSQLKSAVTPRPSIVPPSRLLKIRSPKSKFSNYSKFESPSLISASSNEVFPKWLLERTDFQTCLTSSTDESDIGLICQKPFKLRSSIENRELLHWSSTCTFFKTLSDFTRAEVCEKLSTTFFKPKEILVREGDIGDKMFIILTGSVGIYNSQGFIDSVGCNNIIGEMALESNSRRNATVIAHEHVTTLLLRKEDYVNIVMRQRHKQRYIIVKFIKQVEFFKDLLAAKLEVIAWNMIIVFYKDKQVIYSEGQLANSMYFVKEGIVNLDINVTVTKKSQIPNKKKEILVDKDTYAKVVKVCKPGDFFGEEEVVEKCERKTRAIAIGSTELYIFKKEFLFEILTDKEIKEMLKVHRRIPAINELRKDVRKTVSDKKLKLNAVLDAANVVPLPNGRKELDIAMEKKANIVKTLFEVHKREMSEILLKRESYFIDHKEYPY
ncbi:hypothetical protein SteCoe_8948 [Stentor coeruleus]|uniref:Cyclic nucleotide-binding domain-containing protein n=1 Tax=Stentor coeruleus TaxID=5963 RepID=A0A1R2CJ08_9CILI|nr:hypothetical protein SteCoe_8948 [Stentor coeruleus]